MKQEVCRHVAILCSLLICAVPSYANRKQIAKQMGKALKSSEISRQVAGKVFKNHFNPALGVRGFAVDFERSVKEYDPLFGYGNYNPVLGYKAPQSEGAFAYWLGDDFFPGGTIQVSPVTSRSANMAEHLVSLPEATLPQLTQYIYMWRLANPGQAIEEGSIFYEYAQYEIQKAQDEILGTPTPLAMFYVREFPNITFLERLLDPKFEPKTYAQLVLETPVYPKHVTLNTNGFPVPTPQAQEARLLDNYLMLSHPRVMRMYYSLKEEGDFDYTPFAQTREEHQAAGQLLALRQQAYQIPKNPTPRQLLEITYNQLESHTITYRDLGPDSIQSVAFPDYVRTSLYQHIKRVIAQAQNSPLRASTDLSHLVVLDAVIGGVVDPSIDAEFANGASQDVQAINYVLDSFEKLCRETPYTPENVAHLATLHRGLLRARGIWEYKVSDEVFGRDDFFLLSDEELAALRERIQAFEKLNVGQLIRVL